MWLLFHDCRLLLFASMFTLSRDSSFACCEGGAAVVGYRASWGVGVGAGAEQVDSLCGVVMCFRS